MVPKYLVTFYHAIKKFPLIGSIAILVVPYVERFYAGRHKPNIDYSPDESFREQINFVCKLHQDQILILTEKNEKLSSQVAELEDTLVLLSKVNFNTKLN